MEGLGDLVLLYPGGVYQIDSCYVGTITPNKSHVAISVDVRRPQLEITSLPQGGTVPRSRAYCDALRSISYKRYTLAKGQLRYSTQRKQLHPKVIYYS